MSEQTPLSETTRAVLVKAAGMIVEDATTTLLARQLVILDRIEQHLESIATHSKRKPTIAELEALLAAEDDTPITIHSDGSVTPLSSRDQKDV
jgi:hypothetical protein